MLRAKCTNIFALIGPDLMSNCTDVRYTLMDSCPPTGNLDQYMLWLGYNFTLKGFKSRRVVAYQHKP